MNSNKKMINSNLKKKDNKLKNMRFWRAVRRVLNFVGYVITALSVLLGLSIVICIFCVDYIPDIADFVVSGISGIIALIAVIRIFVSKEKEYVWLGTSYILVMIIGVLLFVVIGVKIENPAKIARIISLISLVITVISELFLNLRNDYRRDLEFDKESIRKFEKLENGRATDNYD